MVLAEARMSPRASRIFCVGNPTDDPSIVKLDAAGPGFINLTLAPALFHDVRAPPWTRISAAAGRVGHERSTWSTSANPTGPMHVGMAAAPSSETPSLTCFRRLPGDPGILHQRCRRAGRRSRPLGLPALSRGPGRRDRTIPEGSILAITSSPSAGQRGVARADAPREVRSRMASSRPPGCDRRDDGDDPGDSPS